MPWRVPRITTITAWAAIIVAGRGRNAYMTRVSLGDWVNRTIRMADCTRLSMIVVRIVPLMRSMASHEPSESVGYS